MVEVEVVLLLLLMVGLTPMTEPRVLGRSFFRVGEAFSGGGGKKPPGGTRPPFKGLCTFASGE